MQFTSFALAALSIGSAFAQTTPSDPKILVTAIDAVASAKTAVDNEVAIIQNTVIGTVNNEIIPAINASLCNIEDELTNVINTVVPLIEDIVLPLLASELATLPILVSDVQYIVCECKDSLSLLLGSLSDDLLSLLKTEVALIIATISPFVDPIVSFAQQATSGTSGTSTSDIQASITVIASYVSAIEGPIETAFNQID
ncbi:hypothetical protein F5Y16DRAFT_201469 [Xylariaceae sp. FL0255]|nr:hypothetical protein F5Y16DRAFT_201469 [Xylariaceae sp. FL0255]